MHRVRVHTGFKDGKSREFFHKQVMEQVNGKLLAFVMAYVGKHHLPFCVKKFMIF
jgi:hypothetical protein